MTCIDKHEVEADELMGHTGGMSRDGLRAAARRLQAVADAADGPQWTTLVVPDAWYERLDEGVRFPVRVLHAAGIETSESCQGGDGHLPEGPFIDLPACAGDDARGFAALHALATYGIDVLSVALIWTVVRGVPAELRWRITLRRTYPERAGERPIFVRGTSPHP